MWIYRQSFVCDPNPDPIVVNSWVSVALDSAWRAVEQFLTINNHQLPGVQGEFWKKWGRTEYWDEASDSGLVRKNRELQEQHLAIALNNSASG